MSKKAEVTCSFIGLGLIGGSIVKALRQAYPEMILKAYDKDRNGLSLARKDGVISEAYEALTDSFFDCDYLFLCAPVSENDQFLGQIRQSLHADTILTDVGSVKQTTHATIEKAGLSSVFIGGHPMAGSEKTGYQNASERLLENAYYILTPTQESPVTAIQGLQTLISSIGAIPLIMDYHTHDYVTAAVSHLPHIISAGLVNLVHDSDSAEGVMKMIAAGGFKDITRISSSSPVMWQSICMTNTENILTLLTSYIESLQKVKAELQNKDAGKLYDLFDDAKNYRDSFSNEGRGPIKKNNVIFVDIPDVPGSIAQTAAILADHDLSIKNIGIMHSREFQQGALKIEFYDEQTANDAVRVLKDNGYQIFA